MTPRRGSEASDSLSMSRAPSFGAGSGASGSDIGIGIRFDPESGRASRSSTGVEVQVDVKYWSGDNVVQGESGEPQRAPIDKDDTKGSGDANGMEGEAAEGEVDHRRDPNDQAADDVLAEDAEEAKVNRKVRLSRSGLHAASKE